MEYISKQEIIEIDKSLAIKYAARLCQEHFSAGIISVKFLNEGLFSLLYRVDMNKEPYAVVIKFLKTKDDMHQYEARGLEILARHTAIFVPKVYFTYNASDFIPLNCVCMEFIKGIEAYSYKRLFFLSKKKKLKFGEIIVNSMLEYHSFRSQKFGSLDNPYYPTWLSYYKPFADGVLTTATQLNKAYLLSDTILNTMEDAYKHFDYIFAEKVISGSLIHGDVNVKNIICQRKTHQPVALIDPLFSKFADREYDLFQLNYFIGKKFKLYELYKKRYKVSERCDIKCAFYALWHEVYLYIRSDFLNEKIMKIAVKNMKHQLNLLKQSEEKKQEMTENEI